MKKTPCLLLLAASVFAASCDHYRYLPHSNNAPLIVQKNDQRAVASLNVSEQIAMADFKYARALSRRIACIGDFSGHSGGFDNDQVAGMKLDGGLGYFLFSPSLQHTPERPVGFGINLFAGAGYGSVFNGYGISRLSEPDLSHGVGGYRLQNVQYFTLASVGFRHSWFEMVVSSRFSYLNFFRGKFVGGNPAVDAVYIYFEKNQRHFVAEPAFTFRGGDHRAKFQFQFGISSIDYNAGSKSFASVGFILTFPKRRGLE